MQSAFDAAMLPDVKMNPDEMVAAIDVIKDKTGDLEFAKANLKNLGHCGRQREVFDSFN